MLIWFFAASKNQTGWVHLKALLTHLYQGELQVIVLPAQIIECLVEYSSSLCNVRCSQIIIVRPL